MRFSPVVHMGKLPLPWRLALLGGAILLMLAIPVGEIYHIIATTAQLTQSAAHLSRVGAAASAASQARVASLRESLYVEILLTALGALGVVVLLAALYGTILRWLGSEQRFQQIIDASNNAIVLVERDGRIVEINRRAVEQFGYERAELLRMPVDQLLAPEHRLVAAARRARVLRDGEHCTSQLTAQRKNQRTFPVELTESRVELNRRRIVIAIFLDMTERQSAEERIRHLAYHDSLTGLPNRALFLDRLEQALRHAHRRDALAAVIFIDLDNFKAVNDTMGHEVGDQLLQAAALRIRAALRAEDTVARLGGDEFVVLTPEAQSPSDAAVVAQKIIQAMTEPFILAGQTFHITCSVGLSLYPRDGRDGGVLLGNADQAMYQAKQEGRNRLAFHTPQLHTTAVEHLHLANDLYAALKQEQLLLAYQPQVDLQSGKIISAEALVRWRHPTRGLVAPNVFIPLAEEKGLILELGNWVLRRVCEQIRRWQAAGVPVAPVAVNLSAVQCREETMFQAVHGILEDTGVAPHLLELELTESTLMTHTESIHARMVKIKNLGLHFALDDFGTGYSSLSYLPRFPIDTLKIDISFIRDMIDDPKDLAVVDTIVDLADNLQLRTVAEGVEKAEQVALLRLLGCQAMQGFYFSKPVGADELAAMLQSDRRLEVPAAAAPVLQAPA